MADSIPIPRALLDRLERAVDLDDVFRRAELPRSRFRVARPQGTTAELFALWRAVEESGAEADIGLRLGVDVLLEMGEIAFLIGFEEVNSFLRAFRAWEGVRPAQWREKHGAQHRASREKRPRAARPR